MTDVLRSASVAVVHGHYLTRGGSEVVAPEIARALDAPLYYGFGDPEGVAADVDFHQLFDGRLAALGRRSDAFCDLYSMWNWQHVPKLHEYDVVVQSGHDVGWYVPPDQQVVVQYLYTTPRTIYDRFPEKGGRFAVRLYGLLARSVRLPSVSYPDRHVAISELVARRVERYWGVDDPPVVYPPIPVGSFEPRERKDYYLVLSRLHPAKRVDEVVRAFADRPDERLVVAGAGPQRAELEALAGDNVEFLGYVPEERKRVLLGEAKALIYAPVNEDFGNPPIEAFASGTPVIGVDEGYTSYQIEDGQNGYLFERGSLGAVLDRFEREGVALDADDIAAAADRYSVESFATDLRRVVRDAIESAAVAVE